MKILFKQNNKEGPLARLGIRQCYVKHLTPATDRRFITNKRHHHTGFEIHVIEQGRQDYELDSEQTCSVKAGQFLLIPPLMRHRNPGGDPATVKTSFTFTLSAHSELSAALPTSPAAFCSAVPKEVLHTAGLLREEQKEGRAFFEELTELRVCECLLLLLREWGLCPAAPSRFEEEDPRFPVALQYIRDNVCRPLTVAEVASYVCVSTKQLNRIFREEAGTCVAERIRRERCRRIEEQIAAGELSFGRISEEMGFSSEYHFHTFFRRYAGMTPGAYRKSIKK